MSNSKQATSSNVSPFSSSSPPLKVAIFQLPQIPTTFLSDVEKIKFQYIRWLYKKFLSIIYHSSSSLNAINEQEENKSSKIAEVDLLILPEMWNCPFGSKYFAAFAECFDDENLEKAVSEIGDYFNKTEENNEKLNEEMRQQADANLSGTISSVFPAVPLLKEVPFSVSTISCMCVAFLMHFARKFNVWIIGGSVPEKEIKEDNEEVIHNGREVRIYNTCPIINKEGKIVCKHRKIHLFDVCIPNGIIFRESDSICSGNKITTFYMHPWGEVGVAICYDIRFAELCTCMRNRGAKLLVFPAAFSSATGAAHWELLLRGRALDNQCFVVGCSPIPSKSGVFKIDKGYRAFGHSQVISPGGEVLKYLTDEVSEIIVEIDFKKVSEAQEQIPIFKQKRNDLYQLIDVKLK